MRSAVYLILVILWLLALALVPFIANWINVAWYILYPLVIALELAFFWAVFSVDARRFAPERHKRAQQTFTREQLDLILSDLLHQWEDGDHSLDTMLGLAQTYLYLGQGEETERFARLAMAEIETVDPADYQQLDWDTAPDDVRLILASGLMYQGRFDEAVQVISTRQPVTKRVNQFKAVTAWLFFLIGDEHRARDNLRTVKPPEESDPALSMSDNLWFMVLFLRQKLLGEDTLTQLHEIADRIAVWNYTLAANKDNPYGARLHVVLDEISDLLPYSWVKKALRRLSILGQGEAMIAEYQAKRDQGDQSYQTAFVLSAAYSYHGYGETAEPLAREALDAIRAEDEFERENDDINYLIDLAHALVFDAMLMQGRFAEAADHFSQHQPRTTAWNLHLVNTAWAYYLAGYDEEARAALSHIKPQSKKTYHAWSKKTQLLHAYLLYKLLMTDSRLRMITLQGALADWDNTVDRIIDNPFRRVIQAMVDDIRAITGIGAPSTADP